jgi:hypothetical protein
LLAWDIKAIRSIAATAALVILSEAKNLSSAQIEERFFGARRASE